MGLFLGFLSCSILSIFLFLCQSHTVLMTVALQYNLKSGRLIPPASFFFLKTTSAIQGLLCFHMNFEIFCSSFVKNAIGNLIGITLNLQIALGSTDTFTILIVSVQEHGFSLDLFVLSLISFISILQISEYRSFASLGKFIPRYFILFVVMIKEVVYLISLSYLSL